VTLAAWANNEPTPPLVWPRHERVGEDHSTRSLIVRAQTLRRLARQAADTLGPDCCRAFS
jgi:hypothetical protein